MHFITYGCLRYVGQEKSPLEVLTKTTAKMKVLFVIDDYATSNNGTSISGQRFVSELRRQGHEVRVMSTIGDGGAKVDYVLQERHIYPFDSLIHSYGFHFAKTDKTIMRKAIGWCDVVHFMMPFGITYFGKQIADELGKPATVAFHIQPENLLSGVNLGKVRWLVNLTYRLWWKCIYSRFEHIHCPTEFMRDMMRAHGYTGDIRAISNGIASDFTYHKTARTAFPQDAIVITMIGRLAHEKRQDLVIEAAKRSKYADRIQLVFAGNGPLKEDYIRQSEGMAHPIVFGYYTKEQLLDILGQTDLYVHASDMESEAIACIEAFATGLVPVISDSKDSATKQFALDDRSLFTAGNAGSLADKIDYWLDHPAEKAAMEQAYARHAENYRLDACVLRFSLMLQTEIRNYGCRPQPAVKHKPLFALSCRVAMAVIVLLAFATGYAHSETTINLPYGDMDKWTTRYIKESGIIGGETKTIYAIGPQDTIRGNVAWRADEHGVIWSTSNVYAKVAGVSKASCSVYPEQRGDGYCARLETHLEQIKALGIINLNVLVTGTIFAGVTLEPVSGKVCSNPEEIIRDGIPFTGHPVALQFDYKAHVASSRVITMAQVSGKIKMREGDDYPMAQIILEHRSVGADGKIYATQVAVARMTITRSTDWINAYRLPVQWLVSDVQPTHLRIQFSSGCQEAYVGTIGNTFWIDNVKLVYE